MSGLHRRPSSLGDTEGELECCLQVYFQVVKKNAHAPHTNYIYRECGGPQSPYLNLSTVPLDSSKFYQQLRVQSPGLETLKYPGVILILGEHTIYTGPQTQGDGREGGCLLRADNSTGYKDKERLLWEGPPHLPSLLLLESSE